MAKTITLNVVNGQVTINPADSTIHVNQSGVPTESVKFKNDSGQPLNVSFSPKTPFTSSNFSVSQHHSDTPQYKSGVSTDNYQYTVSDVGGNSSAPGDIDITTSPHP